MEDRMTDFQSSAVLLRRDAAELDNEAAAVETGLRPQITPPLRLRELAASRRAAAEVLAPGFRGE
jgi:hypothetical protein